MTRWVTPRWNQIKPEMPRSACAAAVSSWSADWDCVCHGKAFKRDW